MRAVVERADGVSNLRSWNVESGTVPVEPPVDPVTCRARAVRAVVEGGVDQVISELSGEKPWLGRSFNIASGPTCISLAYSTCWLLGPQSPGECAGPFSQPPGGVWAAQGTEPASFPS